MKKGEYTPPKSEFLFNSKDLADHFLSSYEWTPDQIAFLKIIKEFGYVIDSVQKIRTVFNLQYYGVKDIKGPMTIEVSASARIRKGGPLKEELIIINF